MNSGIVTSKLDSPSASAIASSSSGPTGMPAGMQYYVGFVVDKMAASRCAIVVLVILAYEQSWIMYIIRTRP